MSKIGFYLLGLFSGILPSLYAWKQVDEANMAKPEISVMKEYVGAFRGWDNGCLNCEQDVAVSSGHTQVKKMRKQEGAYRMGYCECNCKQKNAGE